MKQKIFFTLTGLFLFTLSFGQEREKYHEIPKYSDLVKKAWDLYQAKEFLKSGQKYSEAFAAIGNKGMVNARYNAACSWALAHERDSSFIQLLKIARSGSYINYDHLITDPDLKSLYNDSRWEEVKKIVKTNKEKAEAGLNKALVLILDTIYQEDQNYRVQIEEIEQKYGWKSEEMKAHWNIIDAKDSVNLIKVQKFLDEKGGLGPDMIGKQGNSTLFLVIQHADLQTQQKYLPMMRDAVKKENASARDLALLEDRVALRQGKRQIYGSQIGRDQETSKYYVLPLEDPDNVDKRRSEVGLGNLQDYISYWDITWDVEEYKKKLPEIEAKQKK